MLKLNKKSVLGLIAVCVMLVTLLPAGLVMANLLNEAPQPPSTNLTFSGSSTVYPIVLASVAPFKAANPSVGVVTVDQSSSGQGKRECAWGRNNLGMSSSSISGTTVINNPTDGGFVRAGFVAGQTESANLTGVPIARDALSIAIHNSVTPQIASLSKAQIKGIYEGTITNWSALGGPNMTIVPRARAVGSGTRDTLMSLCGISDSLEQTTINATGLPRAPESSDMITILNNPANTGQIGYVGIGYVSQLTGAYTVPILNEANPPVAIQGTPQNVTANTYPLSRILYLTHNKLAPQYKTAEADLYLNWILQDAGQDVVAQEGFVRLIPDQDVNKDKTINIGDVVSVGLYWGQSGSPGWIRQDVNNDGVVNIGDVVSIGLWWGISYT